MDNPKDILTLLGIPTDKVIPFDYYDGVKELSRINIEFADDRYFCPNRGSKNSTIHGYYDVTLKNLIMRTRNVYVEVRMRRYKRKDCGKKKQTAIQFLHAVSKNF